MALLPPVQTPLNQHSLAALELWLHELGAKKSKEDLCIWTLLMPNWSAEIKIEQDELKVTWEQNGKSSSCSFPYGLSRQDVQIAITEGP
ncbi:DUF3143 domain-containing protein [Prochlorococcus sp. MIT 1307]|uniref:DUF3143 domain-containing protein n=1 Tax=Prochlorococcus sp. MIT 1307 TaxID=3096219 RepID=UPI002A75130D|nr:DUF3143 domain-containing protein [Prochlorococcus sp. MIT 1307]